MLLLNPRATSGAVRCRCSARLAIGRSATRGPLLKDPDLGVRTEALLI